MIIDEKHGVFQGACRYRTTKRWVAAEELIAAGSELISKDDIPISLREAVFKRTATQGFTEQIAMFKEQVYVPEK